MAGWETSSHDSGMLLRHPETERERESDIERLRYRDRA
jgi:hypothetical protein